MRPGHEPARRPARAGPSGAPAGPRRGRPSGDLPPLTASALDAAKRSRHRGDVRAAREIEHGVAAPQDLEADRAGGDRLAHRARQLLLAARRRAASRGTPRRSPARSRQQFMLTSASRPAARAPRRPASRRCRRDTRPGRPGRPRRRARDPRRVALGDERVPFEERRARAREPPRAPRARTTGSSCRS